MTLPFRAITLFAEDAREERTTQVTLVGILPDNLVVPGFPGSLPKLAIYTRIHVPTDVDLPDLSVWMRVGDDPEQQLVSFPKETIEQAQKDARLNGSPQYGLIGQMLASPFPLPVPTRVSVFVRSGDQQELSGSIAFDAAPGVPN